MSPADIHSTSKWLHDLVGLECPWPIKTAEDLQNYARDIVTSELVSAYLPKDNLQRVQELIDELDAPEDKARKARKAKRDKNKHIVLTDDNLHDWLSQIEDELDRSERRRTAHMHGAEVRKQQGAPTRNGIIRRWNNLPGIPERKRAALIAERLRITAKHVRQVVKEAGLR